MTQEQLASRLEIATKNVQRLESGRQNLTLVTVERIADVLGVVPESFFVAPAPAMGAHAHTRGSTLDVVRKPSGKTSVSELVELAARGFSVRASTDSGRRPKAMVPLVDLRIAAGRPRGGIRAPESIGWVALDRATSSPKEHFVARVRGDSMEPGIPNGALVLFGPPSPGPLQRRVFLLEQPDLGDVEFGGPYVVKRIAKVARRADGTRRVTLRSDNREYPDRVLDVAGDQDLRVVAEFVRVLTPNPSR